MNQSFFIGAVGAHQQLKRLGVHGNNIANLNTMGFKANRADFTALLYQNHKGINAELPMGVGTKMLMTSTDFSQGSPSDTGRELDFYIDGEGRLVIAFEADTVAPGAMGSPEFAIPGGLLEGVLARPDLLADVE